MALLGLLPPMMRCTTSHHSDRLSDRHSDCFSSSSQSCVCISRWHQIRSKLLKPSVLIHSEACLRNPHIHPKMHPPKDANTRTHTHTHTHTHTQRLLLGSQHHTNVTSERTPSQGSEKNCVEG